MEVMGLTEETYPYEKPKRSPLKAIIGVLLSAVFFTVTIALSREASARSSVPTVLFFQYLISMIFTLPFMIKGGKKNFKMSKVGAILIRSIAGYLNFAFVFLAIQKTSLVNVVLLNNSAPLFIPLIIWFWKRKKLKWPLWLGMIIGFIGIAIILKPNHEIIKFGGLYGLGSAFCLAISMIAQRRLAKKERIQTVLFYYFLISTIISIPFTIDTWQAINRDTFWLLVLIGCLFAVGQNLFLRACRYEKPSILSSFNYSAVVYGVLIQWFFWNNFPSITDIIGILVVCTGGIVTILYSRRV